MFNDVQLKSHKGLQSAELSDLQKINVFCGPNNGGKTTTLECLKEADLHSMGLRASDEWAKRLADGSVGSAGFGQSSQDISRYNRLVAQALFSKEVWFEGDAERLWEKISWETNFGNWASPAGRLIGEFRRSFLASPATALLPAKRQLETITPINASQTVAFDGKGILNYLFMARNQRQETQAHLSLVKLSHAFHVITGDTTFDTFLQQPTNAAELLFRRDGTPWLNADQCGLGLRDLIIILYFCLVSDYEVVLVEEPENHLHPEIQRRLLHYIRENSAKQVFLSTHSSVFLSTHGVDRIFLCRFTDSVQIENATSRAALLTELGYSISDNLVSDLVVLCEGPTDKAVLEEFFLKIPELRRYSVKLWPLGGDIMSQLDLSVFREGYKVVALVDNDPGSGKVREKFKLRCASEQIPCHRLARYSLENFLSLRAIKSVMNEDVPEGLSELDPSKRVAEQLGFDVKRSGAKIAREMRMDEVEGTDLGDFFREVACAYSFLNQN